MLCSRPAATDPIPNDKQCRHFMVFGIDHVIYRWNFGNSRGFFQNTTNIPEELSQHMDFSESDHFRKQRGYKVIVSRHPDVSHCPNTNSGASGGFQNDTSSSKALIFAQVRYGMIFQTIIGSQKLFGGIYFFFHMKVSYLKVSGKRQRKFCHCATRRNNFPKKKVINFYGKAS